MFPGTPASEVPWLMRCYNLVSSNPSGSTRVPSVGRRNSRKFGHQKDRVGPREPRHGQIKSPSVLLASELVKRWGLKIPEQGNGRVEGL